MLPVPGLVRRRADLAIDVETRLVLYVQTHGRWGRVQMVYDAAVRDAPYAAGDQHYSGFRDDAVGDRQRSELLDRLPWKDGR